MTSEYDLCQHGDILLGSLTWRTWQPLSILPPQEFAREVLASITFADTKESIAERSTGVAACGSFV